MMRRTPGFLLLLAAAMVLGCPGDDDDMSTGDDDSCPPCDDDAGDDDDDDAGDDDTFQPEPASVSLEITVTAEEAANLSQGALLAGATTLDWGTWTAEATDSQVEVSASPEATTYEVDLEIPVPAEADGMMLTDLGFDGPYPPPLVQPFVLSTWQDVDGDGDYAYRLGNQRVDHLHGVARDILIFVHDTLIEESWAELGLTPGWHRLQFTFDAQFEVDGVQVADAGDPFAVDLSCLPLAMPQAPLSLLGPVAGTNLYLQSVMYTAYIGAWDNDVTINVLPVDAGQPPSAWDLVEPPPISEMAPLDFESTLRASAVPLLFEDVDGDHAWRLGSNDVIVLDGGLLNLLWYRELTSATVCWFGRVSEMHDGPLGWQVFDFSSSTVSTEGPIELQAP